MPTDITLEKLNIQIRSKRRNRRRHRNQNNQTTLR